MNILYSCDDKYSPYTGISITSLFENNKDLDEINIYVLGFGISKENISNFDKLAKQYGRNIIIADVAQIDKYLDENGAILFHGSRAPFYRLFLEQVIPDYIEKILYIDSDTVIVGSLKELEEFQFDGDKACAMIYARVFDGYNRYIGCEKNDKYYNSGVLLYNMSNWRNLKCSERLIENIEKGYANFFIVDQDLICHTLNKNIQVMPPKFNVVSDWIDLGLKNLYFYTDANEQNFYSIQEIEYAISNPVILHCNAGRTGAPWVKGNRNPFRHIWGEYKEISLWKDAGRKLKLPFKQKIKNIMYIVLPRYLHCIIFKSYFKRQMQKYYSINGHFR